MNAPQTKLIDLDAMPADYTMLLDMSDGTTIRVRRTARGGFDGHYLDGEFAFHGKPYISNIGETFHVGDAESIEKVVGVRFERDQPPQPEYAVILVGKPLEPWQLALIEALAKSATSNPLVANQIFVGGGLH